MRVVIDTNVFVSAVFFGGLPCQIVTLAEQGKIKLCFIIETFNELQAVLLDEKFAKMRNFLDFPVADFVEKVRNFSLFFSLPSKPPMIIKANPADNYILACALASQAKYIVSGDKHLLGLKSFKDISILTPCQFLARLKK